MGYWRITSWSLRNLVVAAGARQWGSASSGSLRPIDVGDGVVFYCSRGTNRGYWAYGAVTRGLFFSEKRVWLDGSFPFRIEIRLEAPILQKPVTHEHVLKEVQQAGLTHHRRVGVIRLTDKEFHTIENLIDRQREWELTQ